MASGDPLYMDTDDGSEIMPADVAAILREIEEVQSSGTAVVGQGENDGGDDDGALDLEGFEKRLQSLFKNACSGNALQVDSKTFFSDFRKLVEEHTCLWQTPLPQLRILELALHNFDPYLFPVGCEDVLSMLSSLALSVFELLLFFDKNDFDHDPLKHLAVKFQKCQMSLARHQNVHLLQVTNCLQDGGPWANATLQSILTQSTLPQTEVDRYISSQLPVLLELRVRYLLSCERVGEAMALAKCCSKHPTAGQHHFFFQVYLTWLHKTSQHDLLNKELADLNVKDAVRIICNMENEEKDESLLALTKIILSQQLGKGYMDNLCDLVFLWSKLHMRLKTSKEVLLEESHELMLSATNVNSIFPFIRVILEELGKDGIQFCVELCTKALKSCLPCDVGTKSLIYKTLAGLLPNDLETCRACALKVYFLEHTVEAYKMVFQLYTQPDQEYHAEASPVSNQVRFELLQVLKKDLYFDPEFWNLMALRASCINLMSQTVESAALEEILEWVPDYSTNKPDLHLNTHSSTSQQSAEVAPQAGAKKKCQTEDDKNNVTTKRRTTNETAMESFWQLGKTHPQVDTAASTSLLSKTKPAAAVPPKPSQIDDASTALLLKMKQAAVVLPKLGFALWPLVPQLQQSISQKDSVYGSGMLSCDPKDDSSGSSSDSDWLYSGLKSLAKEQTHMRKKARKLKDATFRTLTLQANTNALRSESSLTQPFSCPECLYAFTSQDFLLKHMKRSHSELYCQMLRNGQIPSAAFQQITSTAAVQKRGETDETSSRTPQSLTETLTQPEEVKTLETTSTAKKLHTCKLCDKSFRHVGDLKRHQPVHSGEQPYQCKYCGKGFSDQSNLRKHERIHTGKKSYHCTQCGKAFSRMDCLKIHMRVHTGEKPFRCEQCDKSFSQLGLLKTHQRLHTGEKPFQCKWCDMSFNESGNLKRHHQYMHA